MVIMTLTEPMYVFTTSKGIKIGLLSQNKSEVLKFKELWIAPWI